MISKILEVKFNHSETVIEDNNIISTTTDIKLLNPTLFTKSELQLIGQCILNLVEKLPDNYPKK